MRSSTTFADHVEFIAFQLQIDIDQVLEYSGISPSRWGHLKRTGLPGSNEETAKVAQYFKMPIAYVGLDLESSKISALNHFLETLREERVFPRIQLEEFNKFYASMLSARFRTRDQSSAALAMVNRRISTADIDPLHDTDLPTDQIGPLL